MTDRLAAARARRQPGGELEKTSLIHNTLDDTQEEHELTSFSDAAGGSSTGDFLSEISSLQTWISTLNRNIRTISSLHARSLNSLEEATSSELDELVTQTRTLTGSVKRRIQDLGDQTKDLARKGMIDQREVDLRKNQLGLVRSKFMETIQEYQRVEQEFSAKSQDRAARQYRIVKPDASQDEVEEFVNGGASGQQIFAQATLNQSSARYAESKGAYKEVQERQEEIRKIERTLAELAQLFQDMSILVQQQEETIIAIEATTEDVEKNTHTGLQHTIAAVTSARNARRGRWICFGISVAVIIVIIIIVLVVLHPWQK